MAEAVHIGTWIAVALGTLAIGEAVGILPPFTKIHGQPLRLGVCFSGIWMGATIYRWVGDWWMQ